MKKETLSFMLDLVIVLASITGSTYNAVRALQSYDNHSIELMIAQITASMLSLIALGLFFKIRTQQYSISITKLQRELDRDLVNFHQDLADGYKKNLFLVTEKCKDASHTIEHLQDKLKVYEFNRKTPIIRKQQIKQ